MHSRVGLFFGVSVVLFVVLVYWVITTNVIGGDEADIPALHAYRMVGLVILLVWTWGADEYFWTRNKIDHVLILGFDPRRHHTYHAMFEGASCLTVVWLFFFLTYVIAKSDDLTPLDFLKLLDPHLYALIFFAVSLVFMLLYQLRSQFWLLKTLLQIVCTPFTESSFKVNFMTDQLNSLSIIFYDAEHTACYFLYDYWAHVHDTSVHGFYPSNLASHAECETGAEHAKQMAACERRKIPLQHSRVFELWPARHHP
eukprot:TRINITY_DN43_c0_g1_i4.p1 TRINITY_DN43_c0_g1~~TRINITY_DN43_c0_g1_i4.p1  ORF type:complete len:255 (+),score=54.22 TRINITY_DN43_c0_g1_i4:74-838(+)